MLCGLTLPELEAFAESIGEPRFRGRQIAEWVFAKGAETFDGMTNLPKALRERLPSLASIHAGTVEETRVSRDGTRKLLLRFPDGARVECVAIPEEPSLPADDAGGGRLTFCLSSQVGCPIACAFCATGAAGYRRNLAAAEIVEQFLRLAKASVRRPSNIVFMGMGEPLLNLDHVPKAIEILNDDREGGIGARRITLSTVGLPDLEERLKRLPVKLNLAISLHAAGDAARKALVPHNPVGGVEGLVRIARWYLEETGREVTFEYALLKGVNDRPEDGRALAALLRGVQARVNLIPYNEVPGLPFSPPSPKDALAFETILRDRGVKATIRKRRGDDVSAACGQLTFAREAPSPTAAAAASSDPAPRGTPPAAPGRGSRPRRPGARRRSESREA